MPPVVSLCLAALITTAVRACPLLRTTTLAFRRSYSDANTWVATVAFRVASGCCGDRCIPGGGQLRRVARHEGCLRGARARRSAHRFLPPATGEATKVWIGLHSLHRGQRWLLGRGQRHGRRKRLRASASHLRSGAASRPSTQSAALAAAVAAPTAAGGRASRRQGVRRLCRSRLGSTALCSIVERGPPAVQGQRPASRRGRPSEGTRGDRRDAFHRGRSVSGRRLQLYCRRTAFCSRRAVAGRPTA